MMHVQMDKRGQEGRKKTHDQIDCLDSNIISNSLMLTNDHRPELIEIKPMSIWFTSLQNIHKKAHGFIHMSCVSYVMCAIVFDPNQNVLSI